MTGMASWWIRAYNTSHSIEVNFAPKYAVAQISLSAVSGSGLHYAGIRRYRHRPNPAGADQTVNFAGHFYNQPNIVFQNNMTSVTFKLTLGGNQEAKTLGNVFFW